MIRYNTKRYWGYSTDTKPINAQIGDRFLEMDTQLEYVFSDYNKWELIGLNFTGGTVTGATIFTSGLTANTISATTYQNLPTFITGVTYFQGETTYSISTGGTFSVFGPSNYNPGVISGDTSWSSNNDGSINLPQIRVALHDNPNFFEPLKFYSISSGTTGVGSLPALINNDTNYVIIEYNNGTPRYNVLDNDGTVDWSSILLYMIIYRANNFIHVLEFGDEGAGLPSKLNERMVYTDRFARESGCSLGLSGSTGVVTLSSGVVWNGTNRQIVNDVTSLGLFFRNFHSGGTWVYTTTANTVNNLYYDNGTDLVLATNGKYLVNWYFRGQELNDHLYEVVSNGEFDNILLADASSEPNLPELITSHAFLVGRIIIAVSATTGITQSAFSSVFQPSGAPGVHNDLTNIQGGLPNQYYHLDSNKYNNLALTNIDNNFSVGQTFNSGLTANTISATTYYNLPTINQNAKVNVITVTLGDLGLSEFADNESMLVLSNLYLNSLNEDIPYDTLYQLEIIEGTGTTPTYSTTFISEWNVTNPGDSIVLPYISNGTYYGSIDWGDGTYSINSNSNKIHTYTNSGTYTIKINGIISGFSFLAGGYALTLREIKQWGNLDIGNSGSNFQGCSNLILTGVTDTLKLLSGTTNLQNMFQGCTSITTINNLNDWNVSNVTNMSSMFQNCTSFNQNIGGWDVSKVTTMVNMFRSTSSSGIFNNGGSSSINNWNVSGVTNMSGMFLQQSQFNQPLSGWNVSNVTNMSQMFQMLIFSTNNFNQPIGNWDVSKVTNMSDMFRSLSSFNQPLSGWNVSKVTNMFGMFVRTIFNKNIGNWNVSGVTDMTLMFSTSSFNNEGSPSISGWTTSNVTNMGSMFSQNPSFNQPIGSWNTSKVTNMSQVFQNCTAFNQNIGNWDLSKTTATISMFSNATSFNNNGSSSINNWNVSGVTNMSSMFENATSFNQPIGSWNISNVTFFTLFMNGKTNLNYSSANLDLIYNGWSSRPVKPSINISFGSIKYTSGSTAGRNILTNSPNLWTITDGGI